MTDTKKIPIPVDLPPGSRKAWRELVKVVTELSEEQARTNYKTQVIDQAQSRMFRTFETQSEAIAEQGEYIQGITETYQPITPVLVPTNPILTSGLGVINIEWDGQLLDEGSEEVDEEGDPIGPAPTPIPVPYDSNEGFRFVFAEMSPTGIEEDENDDEFVSDWVQIGQSLNVPGIIVVQAQVGSTQYIRLQSESYSGTRSGYSDVVSIVVEGVALPDVESDIADAIAGAVADAEEAKLSVDGKNKIVVSVTEPVADPGAPFVQGDQWWMRNASDPNQLDGVKIWNGTAFVNYAMVANSLIVPGTVDDTVIADGAIKTTKLDALAVTAEKLAVDAVTANKIAAGAIDGKTITGALIRTAASGQRLQLDTLGLRSFNAGGSITSTLSADTGGLLLSGNMTATGTLSVGATGTNVSAILSTVGGSAGLGLSNGDNRAYLTTYTVSGGSMIAFGGGSPYTHTGTINITASNTLATAATEISNNGRIDLYSALGDIRLLTSQQILLGYGGANTLIYGALRVDGTVTLNGRVNSAHLPYSFAQGGVTITPSAANTATAATVTFPAGRFTVTPRVVAGVSSPNATVGSSGATTSGCTVTIIRNNTTNTVVTWHAVQMTSSDADG